MAHEETNRYTFQALSPDDTDDILSRELLELSIRERNLLDEEIHGVSTLGPSDGDNPLELDISLGRLSDEIAQISDNSPFKAAYLRSQEYDRTYVNNANFRLRFLRCELFDEKKAAERMLAFLDIVADLFGEDCLRRPIRLKDFAFDELKHIRKGPVQILPYRDRSGRPLYAWVGDFEANMGTDRSRLKLALYLFYSMSDDIESQRKGFVGIAWVGSNKIQGIPTKSNFELNLKLMNALPIRLTALHFCVPDLPHWHIIRSMFAMAMGPFRNRIKFHIGDQLELQYALRGFGIPFDQIPVTGSGTIKTNYIRQWMRLRMTLEVARASGEAEASTIIEIPGSYDVIFRAGISLTCHPGNAMFQSLIEEKMMEHDMASQAGKMAITKDIIKIIKEKKGRILQWDNRGWWVEILNDTLVHSKVAASVRNFKTKSGRVQHVQKVNSSTKMFQNQDGKRRKIIHDAGFDSDNSEHRESSSLLPVCEHRFCGGGCKM